MQTALVFNIQKYSIHDGPGIRSTVFFKGCPLLCAWCHNPESQIFTPELFWQCDRCIGCGTCVEVCPQDALSLTPQGLHIDREACDLCGRCADICPTLALEQVGRPMTVAEVMAEIDKDAPFYEQSGGGITLSGGEPLSQADFALELLKACKERGYHTAIDTGGFVPLSVFERVLPYTDLFLYDIKHLDEEAHRRYMQAPIGPIVDNLRWLAAQGAEIWLRIPLIPGVNDAAEHIDRIGALAAELGIKRVHLLPYHKLAAAKYHRLGIKYTLPTLEEPDEQAVEQAAEILRKRGLNVHIGG